jgi:hypothetical protein
LYHSIHAKGENVEDVLREAEAAEAAERSRLDQSGQQPDEAVDAMEDDDAATTAASATAEQSSSMQVPDVSRPLARLSKRTCLSDSFQAAEEHPTATDHQPSERKHPTEPAPVGAAAMPHAALAQGSLPCIALAPAIINFEHFSPGRRVEEPDDGLVFCRVLHRST